MPKLQVSKPIKADAFYDQFISQVIINLKTDFEDYGYEDFIHAWENLRIGLRHSAISIINDVYKLDRETKRMISNSLQDTDHQKAAKDMIFLELKQIIKELRGLGLIDVDKS